MACSLLAGGSSAVLEAGSAVELDAEDAKLGLVLELLSRPGAGLSADEELARQEVSFAAKGMGASAAVRWLLRTQGLAATPAGRDVWKVVRPGELERRANVYKVGRLTPDEEAGERLVGFIRSVVFRAFPWPDAVESLEVGWKRGRLRVVGPAMLHKEVAGVLNAMGQAALEGSEMERMQVKYESLDLGLFRQTAGAEPGALEGRVTVEFADVAAMEAARRLTTAGEATFYVDPLDPELCETRVSLRLEGSPVSDASERLAEELGVEVVRYDGAWVFVRSWRTPLYGDLVVRAYSFSGDRVGRGILDAVEARVKRLRLPERLPYAIERVGQVVLVSLPGMHHRRFEELLDATKRWPGAERRSGRGW